ncbi:hypothetical protein [[Pseudomonas] boreopolis]|uniref:His-Xaa-Ser system protein HxsD n=1 Tax=Xanthomonas boreopolis TaxID=86183 RepID=A0A919FDK5_9XANT|nr:hypothetical protein GCM10009090_37960 [[Pseudomonas] boreopolis]
MESSQYVVDRRLYSDEVVARAAHRYTGQVNVVLTIQGDGLVVVFTALDGGPLPADLSGRFSQDLLDERLRALVRAETAWLQQDLIRAALLQAQPPVAVDV